MASVARQDSIPVPTATTRSTPAERARSSTSPTPSPQASRCACVSIMTGSGGRGVQLDAGKERSCRLDAGRRLREPRPDVVPGEIVALPERYQDLGRRLREVGGDGDRGGAQAVGETVEHTVELVRAALLLGQLPRLRLLDVAIQAPDQIPDGLERRADVELVEALGRSSVHAGDRVGDIR